MDNQTGVLYLDNNATTPVDPRVVSAMMPYFTTTFANANSTHQFGNQAHQAVKAARLQVADVIGAEPHEIIFTSGATESINLALKGVASEYQSKGNHIITVATEHSAVLDTCSYLESKGYEITYLPVQPDGLIDIDLLKSTLRNDTILVSVMYANNETGVLQPIQDIAALAHEFGALFMTDATQAVGKIPIDVDELGIDLLCCSGHKMYAPKGIGALYVRQRDRRVKLPALLHGGGHERGMRSGTLNVPGIVALGKACELAEKEMMEDSGRIAILRQELEEKLLTIPGTVANGSREHRMFNVTNICFPGIDADALIGRMKNVAVSNGSACTSALIEPSHVLVAMGLSSEEAFSAIRFSLGRFNTKNEIDVAIEAVKNAVSTVRVMVNY